jgi:dephospho-CoA kinase
LGYNNGMLKIGLTGGIGCGKSAVADRFRRKGIEVIDADEIAHSLAEPGEAGWKAIVRHFGENILDSEGRLNRAALRETVFNSPEQRQALEGILHPLVYQRIETELGRLNDSYCIVSVPLLLETGRAELFDRILVIDSPVELQYQRVRLRDRLDDSQIRRILDCQVSREDRRLAADDILLNDADWTSLDNQVEKLHNFYLELSKGTG